MVAPSGGTSIGRGCARPVCAAGHRCQHKGHGTFSDIGDGTPVLVACEAAERLLFDNIHLLPAPREVRRRTMTESVVQSFCERCGTRYTHTEQHEQPEEPTGVLGRFKRKPPVETPVQPTVSTSLPSSDRFKGTFHFCMECRQYTCTNCWNPSEGHCIGCRPLGSPKPPASTGSGTAPTSGASDGGGNGEPLSWPSDDVACAAAALAASTAAADDSPTTAPRASSDAGGASDDAADPVELDEWGRPRSADTSGTETPTSPTGPTQATGPSQATQATDTTPPAEATGDESSGFELDPWRGVVFSDEERAAAGSDASASHVAETAAWPRIDQPPPVEPPVESGSAWPEIDRRVGTEPGDIDLPAEEPATLAEEPTPLAEASEEVSERDTRAGEDERRRAAAIAAAAGTAALVTDAPGEPTEAAPEDALPAVTDTTIDVAEVEAAVEDAQVEALAEEPGADAEAIAEVEAAVEDAQVEALAEEPGADAEDAEGPEPLADEPDEQTEAAPEDHVRTGAEVDAAATSLDEADDSDLEVPAPEPSAPGPEEEVSAAERILGVAGAATVAAALESTLEAEGTPKVEHDDVVVAEIPPSTAPPPEAPKPDIRFETPEEADATAEGESEPAPDDAALAPEPPTETPVAPAPPLAPQPPLAPNTVPPSIDVWSTTTGPGPFAQPYEAPTTPPPPPAPEPQAPVAQQPSSTDAPGSQPTAVSPPAQPMSAPPPPDTPPATPAAPSPASAPPPAQIGQQPEAVPPQQPPPSQQPPPTLYASPPPAPMMPTPPLPPPQAPTSSGRKSPGTRACPNCQLPLSARARFCRRCGSPQPT